MTTSTFHSPPLSPKPWHVASGHGGERGRGGSRAGDGGGAGGGTRTRLAAGAGAAQGPHPGSPRRPSRRGRSCTPATPRACRTRTRCASACGSWAARPTSCSCSSSSARRSCWPPRASSSGSSWRCWSWCAARGPGRGNGLVPGPQSLGEEPPHRLGGPRAFLSPPNGAPGGGVRCGSGPAGRSG